MKCPACKSPLRETSAGGMMSEIQGFNVAPPGWASAMAEAACQVQSTLNRTVP